MKRRNIFWIVLTVLILGIQFVRIDKTNPQTDPALDFMTMENPPEDIKGILKNACYDCHSHHTKYPWYSNIAPVSWLIGQHIKMGRADLNFSTWGEYPADKKVHNLEEMVEEVKEGHMPLPNYTWMHRDTKLSEDERKIFIEWLNGLTE